MQRFLKTIQGFNLGVYFRGDLYKGQLRLQLLRTHHNKRRSHFNSTEAKVARLREQLAAAEKICKASELQMEMLGKQVIMD